MSKRKAAAIAAGAALAVLVAGCGQGQFWGPPAPPPPRPKVPAGPGWAADTAYLADHWVRPPKGMQVGILARASSPGYVWRGVLPHLAGRRGDPGRVDRASVVRRGRRRHGGSRSAGK